jgi:SAM-dependent methyltransferase
MSPWERRLTAVSPPSRRLEAELRYAVAAPLIGEAELWVDLGCGTGIAAAAALAEAAVPDTLLVDIDADTLAQAQRMLPRARLLPADLGSSAGVAEVKRTIGDARAVVTCFETLAQLEDFAPCVELLVQLHEHSTVVLSVPNDALWDIENPFHRTMWGEGALDELRRVLPGDHIVLDQVPLAGSAIVSAAHQEVSLQPAQLVSGRAPSHYIVAFGAEIDRLGPLGAVGDIDTNAERRLERQRLSDLAFLEARVAELERGT